MGGLATHLGKHGKQAVRGQLPSLQQNAQRIVQDLHRVFGALPEDLQSEVKGNSEHQPGLVGVVQVAKCTSLGRARQSLQSIRAVLKMQGRSP